MMAQSDHMADGEAASLDAGGKAAKAVMARQCAVTRIVLPRSQLIRFVAGPESQVVPDVKAALPGRGVWVTADPAILAEAVKRKVFARGLKAAVQADDTLLEQVAGLVKARALSALSLAKKAGRLVIGQANIIAALNEGAEVLLLISSDDASDEGVRKIVQAEKRRKEGRDTLRKARVFSGLELDLAFGRSNVIHAALLTMENGQSGWPSKSGRDGILEPLERYLRFKGVWSDAVETNGEPGKAQN